MSRLIVKNLPFSITEGKLRNSFAKHGSVTDLQLKYKEGKFRGFGFIGFSNEDEAQAAKSYLDGTFIGAAKVKVEFCNELGKSEKKNKKKKETLPPPEKNKTTEEGIDKYKDDPKFKEFMSVHQKKDSWDNNDFKNDNVAESKVEGQVLENEDDDEKDEQEEETDGVKAISDLDYLKSKKKPKEPKPKKILFTVKLSGLPFKSKKKDLKTFFAPLKPASLRLPPKIKGIAFVGFLSEKEQKTALNKHKSFLGEHQINVFHHKESQKEQHESSQSKWSQQEASLDGVESVGESGRIFIRNLPYSATEDDISALFSKFGPLSETTVPVDKNTRKYKGFAFVTFMMPEHAVKAFSELDGSTFMGRLLHLLPAKPKEDEGEGGVGEGTDYKKQKDAKLKATAGNSYNWNSLFLDVNAVADVMAAEYGVDKAKVMMEDGKKGSSAAVKLALGETEIVGHTRDFLEQQGVRLDAFNRKPDKRSKTVILAKNLPAKTAAEQLRDKFSGFGVINRLVMPSHSLTAIIEFAEPSEARIAFRKLAYTKFHNAPLYLEWAPDDTFVTPYSKEEEGSEESAGKETVEENQSLMAPMGADTDEPEDGSTLFVKNINFQTSDAELMEHFKSCGQVHSANVATKKNTKTEEVLSMGFGFVTYQLKASAEKALKTLQHSRLAGHCLELKRSTRASTSREENDKQKANLGKPSTKILVRNIPFQAKKEEISQLFRTFGELSAIRLPRKMAGTGDHRGFAFIDFINVSDAKTAFKSLVHSTHLYGRRLVLEWAQGEETLEELRDKTRKHWGDGKSAQAKRTKFDFEKDE